MLFLSGRVMTGNQSKPIQKHLYRTSQKIDREAALSIKLKKLPSRIPSRTSLLGLQKIESEVLNMEKYYISYNNYFGYCVIEEINGNGRIVFAGSIEDCNRKCIELNGGIAI